MSENPDAVHQPPRYALSRRTQLLIVLALALAIVGVAGAVFAVARMAGSSQPRAESAAATPPGTFRPTREQWAALQVQPVRMSPFRTEQLAEGNIALNDDTTTPVFSQYSGRVSKLFARTGDVVRAGTPLMSVEASEFVQAQNDLVAAAGALNSARKQEQLASANESRQHQLFLAKAGALKDWLQSQADLVSAENNVRTAQIALAAVRDRLRILGKSDAEIDVLENAPRSHAATSTAVVRAPIGGTITQRQVGLGQYITSAASGASTPVFSISNLSTVWLVANVRETDAAFIRLGQPVEVRVLAYPGRIFRARIAWIASSLDALTHRLPVRAEVENKDGALKPMMFASFRIVTSDEQRAPAVPRSALVYEGDEAHVFVAREDGTVALRQVRPGRAQRDMVEITSGLAEGEKVVTSGTLFIDRAAQSGRD